jgi:hypothetical protein
MELGDQILIEHFFGGVNGGIGCSFVKTTNWKSS